MNKIIVVAALVVLCGLSIFAQESGEAAGNSNDETDNGGNDMSDYYNNSDGYDDAQTKIANELNGINPGLGDILEDEVDVDSIVLDHKGDIDSYLKGL